MKPLLPFVAAAALLLGLTGCLPVSTNPLSAPEEAVADARLDGVWYGKSGDDEIFLHFVPGTDGNTTDIVEVDHQKSGAHTSSYVMFPTVINDVSYLNIREKGGEDKPYYLARYSLAKNGSLTIWLMSEKPAAKAVKSEKLSGKVTVHNAGETNESRDITITSTTEKLAAFVKKSDPEILFAEKFGTFKKLALPALETPVTPAPKTTPKPKKKKTSDQ